MSRGFLMFAHNNEEVDYARIALVASLMIKRNLKENKVCVITDQGSYDYLVSEVGLELVNQAFDHVVIRGDHYDTKHPPRVFRDTKTEKVLTWYNGTRGDAYDLTPFDETILIDCDVLVQDNMFDQVWDLPDNIIINKKAITLTGKQPKEAERRLSHTSISMYWATFIFFRKSVEAEMFFDLCHHIKDKYNSYCFIYGFPEGLFRNDYVVSIAVHVMNGYIDSQYIKGFPKDEILTSFDVDELVDVRKDSLVFLAEDTDTEKYHLINIGKRTVHCLNKFAILRHADKLIEIYK